MKPKIKAVDVSATTVYIYHLSGDAGGPDTTPKNPIPIIHHTTAIGRQEKSTLNITAFITSVNLSAELLIAELSVLAWVVQSQTIYITKCKSTKVFQIWDKRLLLRFSSDILNA